MRIKILENLNYKEDGVGVMKDSIIHVADEIALKLIKRKKAEIFEGGE